MDSLSIKAKTKVILQNQLKDSSKSSCYLPRIEESFKEQGQSENTTAESNQIQSIKNRKLTNFNTIKWGSLKKFLYKRKMIQNIQMQPSSLQINVQAVNEQPKQQSISCSQSSQLILNTKLIEETNKSNKQSPALSKDEIFRQQAISSIGSVLPNSSLTYISIPQSNSLDQSSVDTYNFTVTNTSEASNLLSTDKIKNINNQQNNIKNNVSTTSTSATTGFNFKQKNLISVKIENQLNIKFKRINKSQLNTTMSDDQQSYEEEIYKQASSSYRNACDVVDHVKFEQKRQKTWESSYSFLENSYKSNGCANFLFSPSPNTSQIIDEQSVPERCQNPLSRDIQFLNLANDENNFLELKKKIMFDEDLFDFEL